MYSLPIRGTAESTKGQKKSHKLGWWDFCLTANTFKKQSGIRQSWEEYSSWQKRDEEKQDQHSSWTKAEITSHREITRVEGECSIASEERNHRTRAQLEGWGLRRATERVGDRVHHGEKGRTERRSRRRVTAPTSRKKEHRGFSRSTAHSWGGMWMNGKERNGEASRWARTVMERASREEAGPETNVWKTNLEGKSPGFPTLLRIFHITNNGVSSLWFSWCKSPEEKSRCGRSRIW